MLVRCRRVKLLANPDVSFQESRKTYVVEALPDLACGERRIDLEQRLGLDRSLQVKMEFRLRQPEDKLT